MRYSWLFFLFLVLLASCGKKEENRFSKITPKLDSLFSQHKDFSGVVLVADSGKVWYHKAFGYRNFETKEPMDTASIFEVNSVYKPLSDLGVRMILEGSGRNSVRDVTFQNFVTARIFVPLKMNSTNVYSFADRQLIKNMAWAYLGVDSTKTIVSCSSDLLKLNRAYPDLRSLPSDDVPGYRTHLSTLNGRHTVIQLSNNAYPQFDALLEKVISAVNL